MALLGSGGCSRNTLTPEQAAALITPQLTGSATVEVPTGPNMRKLDKTLISILVRSGIVQLVDGISGRGDTSVLAGPCSSSVSGPGTSGTNVTVATRNFKAVGTIRETSGGGASVDVEFLGGWDVTDCGKALGKSFMAEGRFTGKATCARSAEGWRCRVESPTGPQQLPL